MDDEYNSDDKTEMLIAGLIGGTLGLLFFVVTAAIAYANW